MIYVSGMDLQDLLIGILPVFLRLWYISNYLRADLRLVLEVFKIKRSIDYGYH